MRQLKIAQVAQEFSSTGGIGAYLLRLCPALGRVGHEVTVIHSDPNSMATPPHVKAQIFVENFYHYEKETHAAESIAEILAHLELLAPDIVHIQNNNNYLLESEIRKRYQSIKSLHVYDFCPSGNKFHHALQKPCNHPTSPRCLGRLAYKRCTLSKRPWVIWRNYQRAVDANKNNAKYGKLIVASDYVKQQAIISGYPPTQIEVIPYFTPLPDPADSNLSGKMVLFVGRVVKEKGLDRLLQALSFVRSEWHLVVAGNGFELNNAKHYAQKLGLADNIEFVGWTDKELFEHFYRQASVVVVPSVWPEPFGIVGIEAMSYAKPVIAFNVGGIPEWLDDKVTGFLIEPYDVEEMAGRIDYLLTHSQEAQEMGRRGRQKVEREFVEARHVERLLKIYEEVINVRTEFATATN